MSPSQLKDFSQSLVATHLFSSNILFWIESGYFEAAAEQKPLLHTWSLAVEEQFYLVFPVVLASSWALGRHHVVGFLSLIAILSLGLSEWGFRTIPDANFFLTPFRLWELVVGAIAAQIALNWHPIRSDTLSIAGIALIIIGFSTFDSTTPNPSAITLIPVLGTVLVLLCSGPTTIRLLSIKPLVGVGLISYSAYLWHQPVFAFARIYSVESLSPLLLSALIGLTVVLAYLTWRWIEQPVRNASHWAYPSTPQFLIGTGVMMLFSIGVGVSGHLTDGFKSRFKEVLEGDVGHTTFHQRLDEYFLDCQPGEIADNALTWNGFLRCKQSRPGPMDWILLGDSHAEHLFLGLAESRPDKNIGFYIQNGKPYLDAPDFQEIFSVLASTPPATVFLAMYYAPRLRHANDLEMQYSKVIEYLSANGHRVVLVGDVPDFKVEPELCKLDNGHRSFARFCNQPTHAFDHTRETYEPVLQKLAARYGIQYIPIHAPLCHADQCSMVLQNQVLYRDRNHLNIPGSRLIGSYLSEQVKD